MYRRRERGADDPDFNDESLKRALGLQQFVVSRQGALAQHSTNSSSINDIHKLTLSNNVNAYQPRRRQSLNANQPRHGFFFNANQPRHGGNLNANQPRHGGNLNANQPRHGGNLNANQPRHGGNLNANQPRHGGNLNANQPRHGGNLNANQPRHGGNLNANQPRHGRNLNANQPRHGGNLNANQPRHGGNLNANQPRHGGNLNDNQPRHGGNLNDNHQRHGHANWSEIEKQQDYGSIVYKQNINHPIHQRRTEIKNSRKPMGFKRLEELSKEGPTNILKFFGDTRNFEEFTRKEYKPDFIVLMLRCIREICHCEFGELKAQLLIKICKSEFLQTLSKYILHIPNTRLVEKPENSLFWDNIEDFLTNLFKFCESVIELSPSTAIEELQTMLDIIKYSIEGLVKYQKEIFSDEFIESFEELQMKFVICLEEESKKAVSRVTAVASTQNAVRKQQLLTPPDDFREIDILPTKYELFHKPSFLRPNIIDGGYQDAEHYLDVQFRLLREDFIAPLRDAIKEYNSDEHKKKRRFSSVRFYHGVNITSVCETRDGMAIEICFDKKLYKNYSKIKDKKKIAKSKRFLYGSLLILTKNDFADLLFCTVVDNDLADYGVLKAYLDPKYFCEELFMETYLMLESDVFFPPYFHVLEALKKPSLARQFPFENYIVKAEATLNPPNYLQMPLNKYELFDGHWVNNGTWPTGKSLGLDSSQYEAYKMALTNEFVTIQGPPGTGKTFIGLKVVETLLKNYFKEDIISLVSHDVKPAILIVCYTNHALDQFLENILPFTQHLIRIGGQSKNENLKQFNLNNKSIRYNKSFYQARDELRAFGSKSNKIRSILSMLESQTDIYDLTDDMNQILDLKKYFLKFRFLDDDTISPLFYWLSMMDKINMNNTEANLDHLLAMNKEVKEEEGYHDSDEEFDDVNRQAVYLEEEGNIALDVASIKLSSVNADKLKENILNQNKILADEVDKGTDYRKMKHAFQKNACHYRIWCVLEERLNHGAVGYKPMPNFDATRDYNIEERWAFYWEWSKFLKTKYVKELNTQMEQYGKIKNTCDEWKQLAYVDVLKQAHIIGATTSGAAKFQSLIRSVGSHIVIVEEAAEVMETHIIVSLTEECQHLIMIGDHQQLRPITASYHLAKHYNLDISLFERMVRNGNQCVQLCVQHRMRPEICNLITPSIYSTLHNHPSVEDYPNVLGVKKNLFFIDHTNEEKLVENAVSKLNEHEAHFLLHLAKYFVQQGYDPSEITMLVAYSGQMFYMREIRKNMPLIRNVRLMVLDNYQGEENKIIILSLVRSNPQKKIGFLSAVNRVCVALSRAKHGFYIIGNMSILKESTALWSEIFTTLEKQQSIGNHLELQCQIHKTITPVNKAADFTLVAEGGCQNACNRILKCGHNCTKLCHTYDMEHEHYQCMQKCQKIICPLEHICQSYCYMECICMIKVKRNLPCGHVIELPCSTDHLSYKCRELVEDVLPLCTHKVRRICSVNINEIKCLVKCEDRLPCGHSCKQLCHKKDDPDHLEYKCMEMCENLNKDCENNHNCQKRCHEECSICTIKVMKRKKCGHVLKTDCHLDVEIEVCYGQCKRMLDCGHHCKSLCRETCDPAKCVVMVSKLKSCGHEIKIECGLNPESKRCFKKCEKLMSCGHKCNLQCYMECDQKKCEEKIINNKYEAVCGHVFKIPCKDTNHDPEIGKLLIMKYCDVACSELLNGCEHACSGSCGKCWMGTLHTPCSSSCDNVMVCGHVCKEPCRLACPPCKVKCQMKCIHSKCSQNCGFPCATCKEKCQKRCEHSACNKLCGEECSVPPCKEPCKKKLNCKHPCRGLCGEECPNVCKECKPDSFPEIFFGTEDEDDARFVKLLDCNHIVEVEGMDQWMNTDTDGMIRIGECPHCKSRILKTPRYMDVVKKMQRNVQAAKFKVFGKPSEIRERVLNLNTSLDDVFENAGLVTKDTNWFAHFKRLQEIIKNHCKSFQKDTNRHSVLNVCLTDVKTYEVHLVILEEIAKVLNKKKESTLSNPCVQYYLKRLLEYMKVCSTKISEQQSEDFNNHLGRFKVLVNVMEIEELCKIRTLSTEKKLKLQKIKKTIIFSKDKLNSKQVQGYMKELNECREALGHEPVTDAERKMIVAAMGFKQGHWYACPKGHPYSIGECGGAMVESKCPECGAPIGGTQHRLLSSNSVAGFMDGARHGAWPGQNNIQDYVLDDF